MVNLDEEYSERMNNEKTMEKCIQGGMNLSKISINGNGIAGMIMLVLSYLERKNFMREIQEH